MTTAIQTYVPPSPRFGIGFTYHPLNTDPARLTARFKDVEYAVNGDSAVTLHNIFCDIAKDQRNNPHIELVQAAKREGVVLEITPIQPERHVA